MAIWDKINQLADKVNTKMSAAQGKESEKSIHDVFMQNLSVGKNFTFAPEVIFYGNETYSYKDVQQINLVSMPNKALVSGTAQIILTNGKVQTLYFDYFQSDRFLKAMNYANEQIKLASGAKVDYKYILQSVCGSSLKVYDDYAQLCYIPSGVKNLMSNQMRGGSVDTAMEFSEMEITLSAINGNNQFEVTVQYNGERYSLTLNAEDMEKAKEALSYIAKERNTNTWATPAAAQTTWEKQSGNERSFSLAGEKLVIPRQMDVLNEYRLEFRALANECADAARKEFDKRVNNLSTYLNFFPKIYGYYLGIMRDKAMQIIIAENIWTVTEDSFLEFHCKNSHSAIDDFNVTLESVKLTIEKNQSTVSTAMSFVPNLVGGGFGLKGAVKGIATATAFNIARDSVEAGLVNSVSNINQAQQKELYERINHDILFNNVFFDYWRVYASMIDVINDNGSAIWTPNADANQKAANIFKNLSNPNFPKDQLTQVFVQILATNPYRAEYHQFMLDHYGKNEETTAITNYFGYTDFNNPRIT